jgi:hypothetical protein
MAPNNQNQNPHYDTQRYAGDTADDVARTQQRMPDEDRSSRSQVQNTITDRQATELAPEVRMGDDRAIGDTPNWQGFTSQQLYDFATTNNSPTTADTLGRGFTEGGNRLAEAANGLFEAVTALEGAWTGEAADSARAALAPLARAAGNTGQTAQMMGVQMSRQSVAASEVRKLPPPEDFNQDQALQAMVTGGPAAMQADLKAQREAADAVKREQITYLNAYTQTMSSVDSQTPSFVPPPERGINPGAGGDARITGSPVGVPASGGKFSGGTSTGGPTGGYVGAAPGSSGPTPGFGPDGEGGGDTGDLMVPGSMPGTSTAGYTPGATPPSATGMTNFGGGPGGGVPAAGAGGFGGAFGNFGGAAAGAAAGFGQGAGGAGAGAGTGQGANTAGPRGGMGPGGVTPTAGVGGRGGAGAGAGGMGAGGRRANGEDDDEHDRPSYLIEGDPESAFGSDQMTAPTVIGGDDAAND